MMSKDCVASTVGKCPDHYDAISLSESQLDAVLERDKNIWMGGMGSPMMMGGVNRMGYNPMMAGNPYSFHDQMVMPELGTAEKKTAVTAISPEDYFERNTTDSISNVKPVLGPLSNQDPEFYRLLSNMMKVNVNENVNSKLQLKPPVAKMNHPFVCIEHKNWEDNGIGNPENKSSFRGK